MKNNLKILFIIRSAEHFFRYSSIICSLCLHGHKVIGLFDKKWGKDKDFERLEKFKQENTNFDYHWLINRGDIWAIILFITRSLLTHRRYLTIKGQSSFFGNRWRRNLPFWLRIPVSLPLVDFVIKTKLASKILWRIENIAPPDIKICNQIKEYHPDVVTAPIGGNRVMSPNVEYPKAAMALGIPTAAPLVSWDSLTTKSLITVFPDIVLLWNEAHKKEAMEHHNIPAERIKLMGASVFDKWFSGLGPSTTKAEFCTKFGLSKNAPFILYLGSAKGTAIDESWVVVALRKDLDNSPDPLLRQVQIVFRPHPSNFAIDFEKMNKKGIAIIPKKSERPDTKESLQLSYDTYYHSAAVVGTFTSAMIEAIIVGKPVIVILSEEYKKTQLEAQHFRHFIQGRAIDLVNNFEEFKNTLKQYLDGSNKHKEKCIEFIKKFVRPRGIEKSAGELAAEEIEKLVQEKTGNN